MAQVPFEEQVAELSVLFQERLRIKGPDLQRQVYKAGRTLPRHVRKSARGVMDMQTLVSHPKLSRQIDERVLQKNLDIVRSHLLEIDPRDRAIGRILSVLAKISIVLIVGFVAVVWYFWSRGAI